MAMIKCPYCKKEISDKAQKCVNCGREINLDGDGKMICSECGTVISKDAIMCPKCGYPVANEKINKKMSIANKIFSIAGTLLIVIIVVILIKIIGNKDDKQIDYVKNTEYSNGYTYGELIDNYIVSPEWTTFGATNNNQPTGIVEVVGESTEKEDIVIQFMGPNGLGRYFIGQDFKVSYFEVDGNSVDPDQAMEVLLYYATDGKIETNNTSSTTSILDEENTASTQEEINAESETTENLTNEQDTITTLNLEELQALSGRYEDTAYATSISISIFSSEEETGVVGVIERDEERYDLYIDPSGEWYDTQYNPLLYFINNEGAKQYLGFYTVDDTTYFDLNSEYRNDSTYELVELYIS